MLIQSGVIVEGSVDKALSGKMYNRGVRIYKLMYEVIARKLLGEMDLTIEETDWLKTNWDKVDFDTLWDREELLKETLHSISAPSEILDEFP